jgi:hypothetical protein
MYNDNFTDATATKAVLERSDVLFMPLLRNATSEFDSTKKEVCTIDGYHTAVRGLNNEFSKEWKSLEEAIKTYTDIATGYDTNTETIIYILNNTKLLACIRSINSTVLFEDLEQFFVKNSKIIKGEKLDDNIASCIGYSASQGDFRYHGALLSMHTTQENQNGMVSFIRRESPDACKQGGSDTEIKNKMNIPLASLEELKDCGNLEALENKFIPQCKSILNELSASKLIAK